MASKTRVLGKLKNVAKVVETGPLKLWVAAYQADPGPPLGPQIGQRGVNIAVFCKDFNEKTKLYRPGIPVPCVLTVNPDKTYKLLIKHPPLPYLVRQAAGIERGAMNPAEETAGYITVKHVYEIAKLKSQDPDYDFIPLEKVCDDVVRAARSLGVKVVHRLDPKEYAEFLEKRAVIVKQQLKEIVEIKEAKLLRA